MLAISYNDIEQAFQISRPSIFPCIIELAERGLIIYVPGNSNKNPSTFYINPKLAGLAKLSHQKSMEAEFEKTLKQQPGLIINEKNQYQTEKPVLTNFMIYARNWESMIMRIKKQSETILQLSR